MTVYIVTHGKKFSGANPGMTEDGFKEVKSLRALLPAEHEIGEVVCGTGKRHLDVLKALLFPVSFARYTSAVGGPDSGEATVKDGPVDVVVLPCGTEVPYEQYTTLVDGAAAMQAVIAALPDNSVVCAGRPSMIMLGMEEKAAKSAAVYAVEVEDGKIVAIREVTALGQAEERTV